jgi:Ca-activated chloride channel family protein
MKNINIAVRPDRKLAWYRGDSVRYLVLDVVGRTLADTESEQRQPLNLALVIDRSGSMHGLPLQAAKQAAAGVVEMLGRDDLLTVICFDSRVDTVVQSLAMDEAGRTQALDRIVHIRPGGTTDLEAGWLRGAECVAEKMGPEGTMRNHVVLLSDGMANQGETDPKVLGEYAEGLQARGILSTTVGIGNGYSPEILQAIAEYGGGRMHDAEHPDEIVEVVTAELGELSQVVADSVRLDIQVPEDTRCRLLSSRQLNREGSGSYSCFLGSIISGRKRRVVLQVTLPGGSKGTELEFHCTVSWSNAGETDTCKASTTITLVKGKKNNSQQRDEEAGLIVAEIWQSRLIRKITGSNIRRDYDSLQKLRQGEFQYFKKYCRGLPNSADMVHAVDRLLSRARRPMHERSRKEMTLAAYKMQTCEPDHRSKARMSWDTYLDD